MGGAKYFDIANIHYIDQGETPNQASNLNVRVFRGLMSDYKINKPIWVQGAELDTGASTNDIIASFNGARAKGASKVFFTQYNIGADAYRYIGNKCDCENQQ